MKNRYFWADVIRIIAIFFVIQIHTSYLSENQTFTNNFMDNLKVISVPLFVLLSGSLLLGKQESYKSFFAKRCTKVLIPWIIWSFFYMLYFYYFENKQIISEYFPDNNFSLMAWSRFYLRNFLSILWFLPMIFGIYLLTPLYRKFITRLNKKDYIYFFSLWFIFISLLPYIFNNPLFPVWEPNLILAPIQFSGYFILGYLIIHKKLFQNIKLSIILIIGILPYVLSNLPTKNEYLQNLTSGFLSPGIVISSIFIFYLLYIFSNQIEKIVNANIKKIIAIISSATFGIYLIHGLFLDYFGKFIIKFLTNYNLEILYSLISFIIVAMIVILLQRIRILRNTIP